MAKDVWMIRHAKSDWDFDVSDFDRPLNNRGFRDAPNMAARLTQQPVLPELLVSSPAKRAITTAQIFAEALHIPPSQIQEEPAIYEGRLPALLQIVAGLDNRYQRIALFGHNPGLAELVEYLGGTEEVMPTCAIVHLHFSDADSWEEISAGTGSLRWYSFPKENSA